MSRIGTHNPQPSQSSSPNMQMKDDSYVFDQIDQSFTFDLFVENFFLNEPSWILKEVCMERGVETNESNCSKESTSLENTVSQSKDYPNRKTGSIHLNNTKIN